MDRVLAIIQIGLAFIAPGLFENSPEYELQRQLDRTLYSMNAVADRYDADICVYAWVHLRTGDGDTTLMQDQPSCSLPFPTDIVYFEYLEALEDSLARVMRSGVRRMVAVGEKYINNDSVDGSQFVCAELSVDVLDNQGRWGNFSVSMCSFPD